MDIGGIIKLYRKSLDMTQVELSQKAGVAINSLRLYEANKRQPGIEQLKRISAVLNISPAIFFFDSSQEENQRPDSLRGCIYELFRQVRGAGDEGTSYLEENEANWLMQILYILEKYEDETIDFKQALSQTKSVMLQCFIPEGVLASSTLEHLLQCDENLKLADRTWCSEIIDAIYDCCDGKGDFERAVSRISLATVQGQALFLTGNTPIEESAENQRFAELLEKCKALNDLGIQKTLEFMEILLDAPKYQRKNDLYDEMPHQRRMSGYKDVFSDPF